MCKIKKIDKKALKKKYQDEIYDDKKTKYRNTTKRKKIYFPIKTIIIITYLKYVYTYIKYVPKYICF